MSDTWISCFVPAGGHRAVPDASLFSLRAGHTDLVLRAGDVTARGDVLFAEAETGGLRAELRGRLFPEHTALEWTVWLENRGGEDTDILSDICAADLLGPVDEGRELIHSGIRGDQCSGESYLPFAYPLRPGDCRRVAPEGGRSSCRAFPCFDLADREGGVIAAIGWSGQWQYILSRDTRSVRLRIGLEDARFYLRPGERIRLPRVLVKAWEGDPDDGHNDFRALLRERFVPRAPAGGPVSLPAAIQCFDRYVHTLPFWATEAGQKEYARRAARVGGIDTVWLDAAWFDGGFPYGVGNWRFQPGFPNGLRPVSEEAHALGMKFMVWFEPERVVRGTDTDREHGGWVTFLPGSRDEEKPSGLLNLARPETVDWLIEKLSSMIRDNGIDIYRQDFNIDPLPFWRLLDEPDRQGLTEIGHIMGLYRLWDTLLSRFPGLVIDNCASGGRRIDLETCTRSVPLWRSDTGCSPSSPSHPSDIWNQNQTLSLSRYILLHAVSSWNPDAHEFRSAATAGIACNFDVFGPDFDYGKAGACMAEFQRLKRYWTGDFYPLGRACLEEDTWSGFQFHRSDLDAGCVLLFRRSGSGCPEKTFALRGVDPDARYRLTLSDEDRRVREREATGRELAEGLSFEIPGPGGSLSAEYTPA